EAGAAAIRIVLRPEPLHELLIVQPTRAMQQQQLDQGGGLLGCPRRVVPWPTGAQDIEAPEEPHAQRRRLRLADGVERRGPSLRSSPWILGTPQSGLAAAILRTRAMISPLTDGR